MLRRQQSNALLAAVCSENTAGLDRKIYTLVKQLQVNGYTIAGVIQRPLSTTVAHGCNAQLFSVSTGKQYTISQKLGTGSSSCNLDTEALEQVAFNISSKISTDTDLVVVNRFSKREAQGGGFRSVFERALELGVPVLTVLQTQWKNYWQEYGEQSVTTLKDNESDLEEWIDSVLVRHHLVSSR